MINAKKVQIGTIDSSFVTKDVTGEQVKIGNESYYKISNVDSMRPFFMSIVSNSNHWMFISSTGGLSAGRKDSHSSLFPYYTDDKITESSEITGSKTLLLVEKEGKTYLWEPFSNLYKGIYKASRNLYKNSFGNKVIFEEINHDLECVFTYEWNSSDRYGFVKKSTLTNKGSGTVKIQALDGIQNILPYGVEEETQIKTSNLVDAYKKSELEKDTGLGIFALSAIIVDKAEPSEALKATVAWSLGMNNPTYLLSSLQLDAFRQGLGIEEEIDVKAEKGAYFICSEISLDANASSNWSIIANVNQSISDVIQIKENIKNKTDLAESIQADIDAGTQKLVDLVSASDGIQKSADKLRNIRHFSNTLFNIMRGGIFDNGYNIEKWDFVKYMAQANRKVYKKKEYILNGLPEVFSLTDLKEIAKKDDDKNFKRLCYEYLPLKFSRRHGDPSRPWNKFTINTRNEVDGSKILDYEGNWRDIFQNWEALAHSYPEFIEGMIHKFLNATTFDGYNPYRVTKGGFDWETIEPDNPWSYIGYWGDHQIIYLLKFLEFIEDHYPGKLESYFTQDLFVYANVPYRIKSYQDILQNPKDTIVFDDENEAKIQHKRSEIGVDGALLRDENFFICKVNFIEKILATVLAKMSNFIPEGGIWMNTQRPEWNDANNALVGNGVSMVTLYYLRRFLSFFQDVLEKSEAQEYAISEELVTFFNEVSATLVDNQDLLNGSFSDADRKKVLDGLGIPASNYRLHIYDHGFKGYAQNITKASLQEFVRVSLAYLEHSIKANKRDDKLFHAYNLMTASSNEVSISYLPEMLEGQVAALSSGYLTTQESVDLLNGLKASSLFRPDQYSYILYPNKDLSRFVDKNNIPADRFAASELLKTLVADGNQQVVSKDCLGQYHFNGTFNNAEKMKEGLAGLPEKYNKLVAQDLPLLLDLYEDLFDHKSFTGRSGTFFGYEGLGSIYWHMVSKLLLAVYEVTQEAIDHNEEGALIGNLFDHYFEINEGIGVNKSPKLYGAFPTDPYSHTPGSKGAQQPGMTGQVKEDILSRFGELGISVQQGCLGFNPQILRTQEFLEADSTFTYMDVNHEKVELPLEAGSMAFTYCQVPVVYKRADNECIEVTFTDKSSKKFNTLSMDLETSTKIFQRTAEVSYVTVCLKK